MRPTFMMENKDWGPGPWLDEPPMMKPVYFEYKGYYCAMRRNQILGVWCGYVGIPLAVYKQQPHLYESMDMYEGTTYSNRKLPWKTTKKNYSGKIWLGFDCGHANDYWPRTIAVMRAAGVPHPMAGENKKNYKTIEFVVAELQKFIDRLIDIESFKLTYTQKEQS